MVGTDPGGTEILRVGGPVRINGALLFQGASNSWNIGADANRLATIFATTFKGNGFNIDNDASASFTNQTSAAAGNTGTLTNAPASGNPAFWLKVNVNGVTRAIPCW